ncbi:hypothetical protein OH146_06015 [Salinibacterium sp. SYSU T00001]|uniref:hypothetical protein n=1 Tax=Homoserinimonas sedimenticola TaxID=2986805 RepID=UPI0022357499|nr:hypothetical protein [Salinibacterium sedimenticola]MCW4385327.1 hypothetical protein [Salinibacterium sedimenticola]
MNNTSARLGMLVAVVVIVALLAGTWFVGIGPRLSEAAAADAERESVETLNAGHEATLKRLEELDAELPALLEELDELRAAFPADSGFPDYFREVEAVAAAAGVTARVVGFEGPELYVPSEAQTDNAELQAALGSVSPDNFLTLSVTLEIEGAHAGVLDAISRLQATQRYVLIHDVALPDGLLAADAPSTATLTGQLFILRDASAVVPSPESEQVPGETVSAN